MRQVILAAMKNRLALPIITVLSGLAFTLYFTACEETLEACQPCGSVLDGAINISGDPRVDGTFDTVKRMREFSQSAARTFQNETSLLRQTFGLPEDADVPDIVTAIEEQLFQVPGGTVTIYLEPAKCWVDALWARELEFSCEERSDCTISRTCTENSAPPYCTGFFSGGCTDNACQGECYQAVSDDNVACIEQCIGLCVEMDAGMCPGRCMGDCSGTCSAYDPNASCSGYCGDTCTGMCELDAAFVCTGQCEGLCQVTLDQDLFVGSLEFGANRPSRPVILFGGHDGLTDSGRAA
jgi:hypothetical protein